MDRESSSSDEEEDRKNLIGQNERPKPKSPIRSTFHVDEFKDSMMGNARRFTFPTFTFNKRYLFAILLPLFILIVYFTTDMKNLFRTRFSNLSFDSSINRMRESELRALYLLREQQLGF